MAINWTDALSTLAAGQVIFWGGALSERWIFAPRREVTECAPDNHNFRQLNDSNAFVCRDCGKKIAP